MKLQTNREFVGLVCSFLGRRIKLGSTLDQRYLLVVQTSFLLSETLTLVSESTIISFRILFIVNTQRETLAFEAF